MSVQTETSRVHYMGNGSAHLEYQVPFYFLDPADITVIITDPAGHDIPLAYPTDYTVRVADGALGGGVLTSAAWSALHKVTIYRQVPATQTTVYEENANFPAKSHERALDKLTMLVQQLGRKVLSSFRSRESDGVIPEIAAVPSSLMGFDANTHPRAMTADQVAVWLNMTQGFFGQGTITFPNETDRNAAAPQFLGQIGVQSDTLAVYTGSATTPGAWGTPINGIANSSITTAMLADNALTANNAGRAKMADGYLTQQKIASGAFAANMSGREKFEPGFVDATLCTANLWRSIAPAGAVINSTDASYPYPAAVATQIPISGVPSATAGFEMFNITITPTSATSRFRIRFNAWGANSTSGGGNVVAAFRGTTNIGAHFQQTYGGNYCVNLATEFLDTPNTLQPVTYSIRVGPSSATIMYVNTSNGSAAIGGAPSAKLVIEEIKA